MDKNKIDWTDVERKVLNFLFENPTTSFRGRELARNLDVSPTSITNATKNLSKKNLVICKKDILLKIKLNRDNPKTFQLKRIYNLSKIYESNLIDFISKRDIGSTIVIFGSYSLGEDTEESDIDLALIGGIKPNKLNDEISQFESKKILGHKINIEYIKNFKEIKDAIKESIINGIVLKGVLQI